MEPGTDSAAAWLYDLRAGDPIEWPPCVYPSWQALSEAAEAGEPDALSIRAWWRGVARGALTCAVRGGVQGYISVPLARRTGLGL